MVIEDYLIGDCLKEDLTGLDSDNLFEVNNYLAFISSACLNKRKQFLSKYTLEDLIREKIRTFKLKGYDAGFAIKDDGEITCIHNCTSIHRLRNLLVQTAIKNGGNKLNHFDGYLSSVYEPLGFVEVGRIPFDPALAPEDWDYEKYGTPDLVYRELKQKR